MIVSIVAFDMWFEQVMLSMRTPVFVRVFEVVIFFGNEYTVMGIAGIIVLALRYSPRGRPFIAGFVTMLAGAVVSALALKYLVHRARPGGLLPAIPETGFSFPSWHATGSMALYGFIAFLLCRLYPRYTKVVIGVATVIILAIGFGRLYLGVHFPSDVIGGYVLGGLWLALGVWMVGKSNR